MCMVMYVRETVRWDKEGHEEEKEKERKKLTEDEVEARGSRKRKALGGRR